MLQAVSYSSGMSSERLSTTLSHLQTVNNYNKYPWNEQYYGNTEKPDKNP